MSELVIELFKTVHYAIARCPYCQVNNSVFVYSPKFKCCVIKCWKCNRTYHGVIETVECLFCKSSLHWCKTFKKVKARVKTKDIKQVRKIRGEQHGKKETKGNPDTS